MEINKIYSGDCREIMKGFAENSVDSICCDPPYEIEFMGKQWDKSGIAYDIKVWEQCLRILKPGGHLLSFGGTRTYHRMVCAIEDAGFEIRDTLQWIYGSGFPKSLDIGKQVDKIQGNEREVIGFSKNEPDFRDVRKKVKEIEGIDKLSFGLISNAKRKDLPITKGDSEYEGSGTGLKPACEMICLARKPISEKNIAENILKWGTGGLNIDGCRIEHNEERKTTKRKQRSAGWNMENCGFDSEKNENASADEKGRFPSNVLLDEEAAKMLDEKSGVLSSGAMRKAYKYTNTGYSLGDPSGETKSIHEADSGGASRFFYIAKASRSEREDGLEGFEEEIGGMRSETSGQHITKRDGGDPKLVKNNHPTVKPIKLMRYLVRLVTPPKGICVDPFAGSGTTPIGCIFEDFRYIAIENKKRYFDIMEKRVFHYKRQGKLF